MNFFLVYVALPALFYRIVAQTPLEKLRQVDFIFATTLATFWAFSISFAIGAGQPGDGRLDIAAPHRHRGNAFVLWRGERHQRLRQYRLVPSLDVVKRIVSHPLMIATALGVVSAAVHFQPPLALERLMQ